MGHLHAVLVEVQAPRITEICGQRHLVVQFWTFQMPIPTRIMDMVWVFSTLEM